MREIGFKLYKGSVLQGLVELEIGGIIDVAYEWDMACQFTGLTDKNGKDLFEGDVVKFKLFGKHYVAKVKYDETHACFLFLTGKAALSMFDMWDDKLEIYPVFEIIGSTHETPEPLFF